MATKLEFSPALNAGARGMGAFFLELSEDGGLVTDSRMSVGWGRRGLEQLATRLPFAQALHYVERADFLAAPAYAMAVAGAFEELLELEVPERAHFVRMMLLEINRVASHLQFYVNLARVAGQLPLMHHCQRERERFSDVMEMFCGSRLGFGAVCLGGVAADATDGWFFRIEKAAAALEEFLPELDGLLLQHPFFVERADTLARLSPAQASSWNLLGPNARACGLPELDERVRQPCGAYRQIKIPPLEGGVPRGGDVLSRCRIRSAEIRQSVKLIKDAFSRIPAGSYRVRVGVGVCPEAGTAISSVEGPRGAILALVETAGENVPADVRLFAPSTMALQLLPAVLRGIQAEDAFLAIQSFDPSFSEVDK